MSIKVKDDMRRWSKVAKNNSLAYADSLDRGVDRIEELEELANAVISHSDSQVLINQARELIK